jgi:hypothetical protein
MQAGQKKKDWEFVKYRRDKQLAFWSKLVRGEIEGLDVSNVDPEILDCCVNGKYFRGEGHTSPPDGSGREKSPMEELWLLYIGIEHMSEEDEARGKDKPKKKKKGREETIVEPIRARRVVGNELLDKKGNPSGEFSYDMIQYLDDRKGTPTGQGNTYDPIHFHDDGYLHFDQWLYARDQARKDLFWFNVAVLGNTKMTRITHQPVCDQFIQKDFDGVYRPGYSVDTVQAAIKRQNRVPVIWSPSVKNYVPRPGAEEDADNYRRIMILLYPRAFFKSTIGRADAIQWILCCPDISMMIMTAAKDLAALFVKEIKKEFYLARGASPRPIHLLFPEYVLRGVDGTSAEDLITPARRRERTYPTLWADSIDSTLSGWHCDIMKFDDVVSNTNCNTDPTREKLERSLNDTLNLCDTWGKIDALGTRYYKDDYYGVRHEKSLEDPDASGLKWFSRPAWYVKPEFMHVAKKNLRDLQEHMVILTFPEHATFKYLMGLLKNDEKSFRCQQLNDPVWGGFSIYFKEDDLKRARVSPEQARAYRGDIYILWDTAKEAKKNSDYTVGVVMKVFRKEEDGQVAACMMEAIYGHWTQTEIAYYVATLNKKWNPKINQIEDTGGLELLQVEIQKRSLQICGFYLPVYFHKPSNEDNAKRNRIKGLEVLLNTGRLFFAIGSWLEDKDGVFPQLISYTGEKSTRTRKDDIPDAMAYIGRYLPSSVPLNPKEQEEKAIQEEQFYNERLRREQYNRMFGDPGIPTAPAVEYIPEPSSPSGDIRAKYLGR